MFCVKCGNQMSEGDLFCRNCGNKVSVNSVVESNNYDNTEFVDNVVQLRLKPVYAAGYKLIISFFEVGLFLLIFLFLVMRPLSRVGESDAVYDLASIISLKWVFVILLIFTGIKMVFDFFQYRALEYNFYKVKVEYKNGFLAKMEKELKYKNVREVSMSQNILERIFRIGTICIFTNASNTSNGIYIHCIDNVEEEYRKVKAIIDDANKER